MKFWQKISTWIIILILGMVNSCSSPERKTALVITFDVEDYISPESERIDEIPKWLATIMSEEGVTGTFFVIAKRARGCHRRDGQA